PRQEVGRRQTVRRRPQGGSQAWQQRRRTQGCEEKGRRQEGRQRCHEEGRQEGRKGRQEEEGREKALVPAPSSRLVKKSPVFSSLRAEVTADWRPTPQLPITPRR